MNQAKLKLKDIVKDYKNVFPSEYVAVCDIVSQKRKNAKDQFASVRGQNANKSHMRLERALYEISETLMTIINKQLDRDELEWFKSKEGGRWFCQTFPQFSLAEIN